MAPLSINTTLAPSWAAPAATLNPADPPPMTHTSQSIGAAVDLRTWCISGGILERMWVSFVPLGRPPLQGTGGQSPDRPCRQAPVRELGRNFLISIGTIASAARAANAIAISGVNMSCTVGARPARCAAWTTPSRLWPR